MKFVKNELQNKIVDEWMNDNLIVYVEKKIYLIVLIMSQNMKSCREQL